MLDADDPLDHPMSETSPPAPPSGVTSGSAASTTASSDIVGRDKVSGDNTGANKIVIHGDNNTVNVSAFQWELLFEKETFDWFVKQRGEPAKERWQADWEQVDWKQAAATYLVELKERYGSVHIFGMTQAVPLAAIFTAVYLLDKPSAWRRHTIEELRKHRPDATELPLREQRQEGAALVTTYQRLFILGQPGAGKTTFLKHLVMQAIQGQPDAIPVFVSLKDWADSASNLLPFLARQFAICGFPDAQPFVEAILRNGKAMILFDGLDEVSAEAGKRRQITQTVRDFTHQYSRSRVVITCRTAANEYVFEQFNYCEMASFSQEEIETFVGRWFQRDAIKRTGFLQGLAQPDNKGLLEMARQPLLLTMLCLTFEETMAFPQRRAELYEEAIDALLKKWDSSRSIQRDTGYRKLSLGHKRELLIELAYETFQQGEFFMPKGELTARIAHFLRRLPPPETDENIDGEAVLKALEAQHGLLIERARDIYSFSHLSFHEYFTACHIVAHPEPSVLLGVVEQAADAQRREVLLLTSSMLDYRNVAHLFHIWQEQQQLLLQGDSTIRALVQEAAHRAVAIGRADGSTRALALTVLLIQEARARLQELSAFFASANDSAHAHARALALDHALDRATANDLPRDLPRDFFDALAHVFPLINDHALDRALDRDHLARVLLLAHTFSDSYAHCSRYLATMPQLTTEQRDALLAPRQDWRLSRQQLDTLQHYATSVLRLLECMDLAALENREALLNQILLPATQELP